MKNKKIIVTSIVLFLALIFILWYGLRQNKVEDENTLKIDVIEEKEQWVKVEPKLDVILPFEVLDIEKGIVTIKIHQEGKLEEIIGTVENIIEDIKILNPGFETDDLFIEIYTEGETIKYDYSKKLVENN